MYLTVYVKDITHHARIRKGDGNRHNGFDTVMIWGILFAVTTTAFGVMLRIRIQKSRNAIISCLAAGWLIGSMTTGFVIFITGFFIPLSLTHILCVMVLQVLVALYLYVKGGIMLSFGNWFTVVTVLLVAACGLFHLIDVYRDSPEKVHSEIHEFFDFEVSFVNSVLRGCNYRRSSFSVFSDPLHAGHTVCIPVLPNLYLTALVTAGMSFESASILIKFMNIVSTECAIILLAGDLMAPVITVMLLFMFNCGLVSDASTMSLLVGSNHGSFSIPITLFSIFFASQRQSHEFYILAGVFLAMNPSPAASLASLVCISNFANSVKVTLPFALSVLPKLFDAKISYKPFWIEHQMNGVFYSQILVWFEYLGPAFFGIIVFWMCRSGLLVHRFLSAMAGWIVLCFARFGNDRLENTIGITGVFLPLLIISLVQYLKERLHNHDTVKGAVLALAVISIIYGVKQLFNGRKLDGFSVQDFDIAEVIEKFVKDERVFSLEMDRNPAAVLSGRAVFAHNVTSLWRRGAAVKSEVEALRWIKQTGNIYEIMKRLGYKILLMKEFVDSEHFDVVYSNDKFVLMKCK